MAIKQLSKAFVIVDLINGTIRCSSRAHKFQGKREQSKDVIAAPSLSPFSCLVSPPPCLPAVLPSF
ncbi:hypothetical protein KFK09_016043 [Dendrobium nobile]|uniref:Uncharacterized protein n=1 Tax=Dendrobium nobile TaxID=94219 RepID=A0A8T3BC55_DENNO|nr:hypothetical protein KFK09_016043 [Dendrobium nobile]